MVAAVRTVVSHVSVISSHLRTSGPFEGCPHDAGITVGPVGAPAVRPGERLHDVQPMGPVILPARAPRTSHVLDLHPRRPRRQLTADVEGPAPGPGVQDRVGSKLISDENQILSNGTLTQVGGDLLTDPRYFIGPPVKRALVSLSVAVRKSPYMAKSRSSLVAS